jgi:hypothetical protein
MDTSPPTEPWTDGARFGATPGGQSRAMVLRVLRPTKLLNPISRMALMTFTWNHRHEILRWGRSLYDQVVGRDVSPARALRTGRLLVAIASDRRLRDAKQLRRVTMSGGTVDLAVDESWSELPRLIERVRAVKGVDRVTVNGTVRSPLTVVEAASA